VHLLVSALVARLELWTTDPALATVTKELGLVTNSLASGGWRELVDRCGVSRKLMVQAAAQANSKSRWFRARDLNPPTVPVSCCLSDGTSEGGPTRTLGSHGAVVCGTMWHFFRSTRLYVLSPDTESFGNSLPATT
jgi:hypothetical protein